MSKDKETKIFYLGYDGESPDDIVINCINAMLSNNGFIFYVHNLGGFDSLYIIGILMRYNANVGAEVYGISPVYRGLNTLKIVVSLNMKPEEGVVGKFTTLKKKPRITILDSYALLPMSLDVLSKSFGSSVTKGIFPYDFVTRDTLNYVGNTPDISYYPKHRVSREDLSA